MSRMSLTAGLVLAGLFAVPLAQAETPSPVDAGAEEDFLKILPPIAVPEDVQLIPGAVNEEFRNCKASWPAEYAVSQKGPEARAYRDIYGFVKVRNVIETQDCSCAGKVATWHDVEAIAMKLRDQNHVPNLGWQQTEEIYLESEKLFPVAETMCGGRF